MAPLRLLLPAHPGGRSCGETRAVNNAAPWGDTVPAPGGTTGEGLREPGGGRGSSEGVGTPEDGAAGTQR